MNNHNRYPFADTLQRALEVHDGQGQDMPTRKSGRTLMPEVAQPATEQELADQAQRVADAREDVMKALESVDA